MLDEPILKKKVKNNKNYGILAIMLVAITLIGGVYAFFQYSREGDEKSQLLAGDVYLHFKETGNEIALNQNAFPETPEEARAEGRTDNILTFTIDGKNTTENKNIYYEIKLMYGENNNSKTRLNDSDLRFDLEEKINGVTTRVLDNVSYDTINNTRIWVNKIESGEEVEINYTLRVWLSDEILISDTDPNATYTTGEYSKKYASIKVAVYGDFEEKHLPTAVDMIKAKVGTDGLVGINTNGELASEGDTIREYRYSGSARYCTYTSGENTYTLNVESYETTCPNACLNSSNIIHKTSDALSNGVSCQTELTANETTPLEGEVKNYVEYNGEKWRIIGIFNETVRDGETEEEQELIKIVKDTPISADAFEGTTYTYNGTRMTLRYTGYTSPYSYFYWNKSKYFGQTNDNDWTQGALRYYLNDETIGASSYYNSIDAEERDRIATVKYHLGTVDNSNNPANVAYTQERGTNGWGDTNEWFGKIGLMYPSDYGYAADNKNWTTALCYYYKLTKTGSQKNWLRDESKYWEWLISSGATTSSSAMYVDNRGYVIGSYVSNYGVVSPVLYLKSETTISGGTGAWNDAYTLG